MTATSLASTFAVHGIGVEVAADNPVVLRSVEQRFREFARARVRTARLHFDFRESDPQTPGGAFRPVYETPLGALHYFPSRDVLHGTLAGVTLHCDPRHGRAAIHTPSFAGQALYVATHPLLTVTLMELLERRGMFSLHAACVAGPGGQGVVVAGPSGSGKSTLTLALVRAGMAFLSDDVIFLSGEGRVLGFSDTIGVTDDTVRLFPQLGVTVAPAPDDGFPKRLARVEDLFGRRAVPVCVPRVLVFPTVAPSRPSAIEPLDAGEALLRLVPDVLLTDPEATQAHLAAIARLLDDVDCYALRSGSDLARAAGLVARLL